MATRRGFIKGSAALGAAGLGSFLLPAPAGANAQQIRNHPDARTVALIGDYGAETVGQRRVADMVASWNPDAVFTMGDNVYSADGRDPYELLERKVVNYYRPFIERGTFYPSLGNHDWGDPGTPLLEVTAAGGTRGAWHDVFSLPGNGRYYDVRIGSMHAFIIDDYYLEPDGHRENSRQAQWLRETASASDATFKFVVHHFAPYVLGRPGKASIRWPFAQWGIDASFSGHWHHYERRALDGVHYVVNGLGGAVFGYSGQIADGVSALYSASNGASRLTVAPNGAYVEFISIDGVIRDAAVLEYLGQPQIPNPDPEPEPPRPPAESNLPIVPARYRNATGRAAVIARLYLATFERVPDDAGHSYWVGLDAATADIAAYFIASPEFQLRYGSLTNSQFVDRVYRNVLGRTADADGASYWRGLLDKNIDRSDVMLGFSESVEFRNRTGIRS